MVVLRQIFLFVGPVDLWVAHASITYPVDTVRTIRFVFDFLQFCIEQADANDITKRILKSIFVAKIQEIIKIMYI